MRHMVGRKLVGILIAAVGWMTLTGGVLGQVRVGPFEDGDGWFIGPDGLSNGLRFIESIPGSGVYDRIQRVWDLSIYTLPPEIVPDAATHTLEFHLSPSQQYLVVQKQRPTGPLCSAPDVEIFMYELLPDPEPTLEPFTGGIPCIQGPVGLPEFFDHPGPVRTMFLAGDLGAAPNNSKHEVLWADLVNRQIGLDVDTYLNGINLVHFAPSGEAAFITHGLSIPEPDQYTFVSLCATGGSLGGVASTDDLPGQIQMRVEQDPASGEFEAVLVVGGDDQPNPFPIDTDCYGGPMACCRLSEPCQDGLSAEDCSASGGQPVPGTCASAECVEACCGPDGSCGLLDYTNPDCVAQGSFTCDGVSCPVPEEACCQLNGDCDDMPPWMCTMITGAVPQGPGTRCRDDFGVPLVTCPRLSLALTKSGPDQARQGEAFDYTIDYVNDGDLLAPAVVLEDNLPYGLNFVSASDDGQDVGFNQIQWSLGDLPVASSGRVTVTVEPDCYASSALNMATSTIMGWLFFSSPWSTQILPALTDPVTVTVTSVPQDGSPVEGGELITHTVTLTNTAAESRPGIWFSIFTGSGMSLETLIDDSGGNVQMFSPDSWEWKGTLGPSATVDIVFTTRVEACVDVDDVGLRKIRVMNPCNEEVGSADPDRLPVRRAVEVDYLATSLNPPATLETFTSRNTYQLLRRGDTVDFRFTATNPHATPINVSITAPLPFGFDPDGNPPFIPPTDPAASWDAVARRIEWAGTIAPQQTVTISYRATQTADILTSSLTGWASDGTCTMFAGATLAILPELPADPYLIGLYDDRLWTLRPGIDSAPQDFFPFITEYLKGMGRGDNGDLWVVPLPTFRINPETLELQGLGVDFLERLGFTPSDVAVDPTDGTVLFGGGLTVGSDTFAAIRRYDPVTDQITTVFDEPGPLASIASVEEIVVEPTGEIGFRSINRGLYRLDPGVGTPTDLGDSTVMTLYGQLALDQDGSYLVSAFNFSGPHLLADVAPQSGQHTTIAPDLQTLLPSAQLPPWSLIGGDGGDVYFGYSYSGLGVLHRQPTLSADELLPFDFFGREILDLAFSSAGACTDDDGDGAPSGPGCATGTALDCDNADADVYPGAPEINDGKDNQCPGDPGSGAVDEVSGVVSITAAGEVCWPAQGGATEYEVVRSATPDFSTDCMRVTTPSSCWTDSSQPPAAETWYYLVRALAPFVGSFGLDSTGAERTVACP